MEHDYFMREALKEAEKAAALGEVPIGAIIVHDGMILARAHNLRETDGDPTAHAEILAIRKAAEVRGGWRLIGSRLYVTVEPCPMCAGALVLARIQLLVYGTADLKAGAVDSLMNLVQFPALNHKVEVISGVLEQECREEMQKFFRRLRK
ncbi:MAG: tRNA adenosine(34) deaminase TadA [Bacillota bacterium]